MARFIFRISRPNFERRRPLGLFAAATIAWGDLLLATAGAAPARPPPAPSDVSNFGQGVAEVVVVAQRRRERLQDVPVAIEALTGDEVRKLNLTSDTDLGMVTPGLVSASQVGYFQPHLRGIGTTAPSASVENPVAVYVDGIYYGMQSGSILSLSSISNIEVDKGPQGTLFGRNATGGLIQITTKDPSEAFNGALSLTGGDYRTSGGSLYVSGGVTSNLLSNLSVYYQNQAQGFGKNEFNGEDVNYSTDLEVRAKALFAPTLKDSFLLTFDYGSNRSAPVLVPAPETTPLGGSPYTGPREGADGYYQPFQSAKGGGIAVKADHDLGYATLESVSAYRRSRLESALDGTLVTDPNFALNVELSDRHEQFTEELTLKSAPSVPITWTTGLFFYHSDARYAPTKLSGGLIFPLRNYLTFSNAITYSGAVFGQATMKVAKATNLTLGMRYTVEQKYFSESQYGVLPGQVPILFAIASGESQYVAQPSWRIVLDRRLSNRAMVYASYNRGFKSGGFDDLQLPVRTYEPETLDAYEVGGKSSFLNNRLQLNFSGFYYDYSNVQTVAYPAGTEIIYSAPHATLYGLDVDLKVAPLKNLSIMAGLEFLHATYGAFPNAQLSIPDPGGGTTLATFNAKGEALPLAPDWTFDIAPQYIVALGSHGSLEFDVAFSYSSGFYYEPDNRLKQGAYTVVNASLVWTSPANTYALKLWAKNLSNNIYTTAMYAQTNGDYATYAPPRTFGMTVSRNF